MKTFIKKSIQEKFELAQELIEKGILKEDVARMLHRQMSTIRLWARFKTYQEFSNYSNRAKAKFESKKNHKFFKLPSLRHQDAPKSVDLSEQVRNSFEFMDRRLDTIESMIRSLTEEPIR